MQFLDKWHRSRLTSQDFICSIFRDNINHQKQREAKYKGVDLRDVISRIVHIWAVPKKGRGSSLQKLEGPFFYQALQTYNYCDRLIQAYRIVTSCENTYMLHF